jgi:hypothetical protein
MSEWAMYGLMFILPLIGWGMQSAVRYQRRAKNLAPNLAWRQR